MSVRQTLPIRPKLVKVVAAIVIGLSIGTLVPPDAVMLPVLGRVSGIVVGAVGLLAGTLLYRRAPDLTGTANCGCSGECGCA